MPLDASPGLVTRSIIESISTRTAEVVEQLAEVASFDEILLFGGAARMELLVRRLGELTGLGVRVGPMEATALGNAIVQGIATGALASLDEGRARIPSSQD